MKLPTPVVLMITHGIVGIVGFAAGIYMLPILTAPEAPTEAAIMAMSQEVQFTTEFSKDLKGSDALHWGEGTVRLGPDHISFVGELSPGPNYKLYLSPAFVETEADFHRLQSSMVVVGDVKTFDNFVVKVAPDVAISDFNTVIVWCEAFGEFITAAKYQ